jgi:hypothetical protein
MNLVKSVREAEKRSLKHRTNMVILFSACFGLLALASYNTYLKIMTMENEIAKEKNKLALIEAEFRNYNATQSIIDKDDIELLNKIQTSRVYWTRKLDAMASHLPEEEPISYWITKFGYRAPTFTVQGYGYITGKQEQLLTLDNYLTKLRADKENYSDLFGSTVLKSAARSDEDDRRGGIRERVSFEYNSTKKGGAKK